MHKKKLLVLFPNQWDRFAFGRPEFNSNYDIYFFGRDFFSLPGILGLPFLNVSKLIKKICDKACSLNIDGIMSSDEYIGAVTAAAASKKMGLPGSNPALLLLCQHKYLSRQAQNNLVPQASVRSIAIPATLGPNYLSELAYPFFVKPIKGTFSLFAKKVDTLASLKKHLNFRFWERLIFKWINAPFLDFLSICGVNHDSTASFIGEELIDGTQVTVDGFCFNGEVVVCGVVDSVMFDNTNIFQRFEYPSRLSQDVQSRMASITKTLIEGMEFDSAQFNVEFFYNAKTDDIKIIEVNPRLSYQFADLYEYVDGCNTYDILASLAVGEKPDFLHGGGKFRLATSFVMRTFEAKKITGTPSIENVEELRSHYPESRIVVYAKKGTRTATEMRAIGSYRYGIMNVAANSYLDIFAIYEDAKEKLPFSFQT